MIIFSKLSSLAIKESANPHFFFGTAMRILLIATYPPLESISGSKNNKSKGFPVNYKFGTQQVRNGSGP